MEVNQQLMALQSEYLLLKMVNTMNMNHIKASLKLSMPGGKQVRPTQLMLRPQQKVRKKLNFKMLKKPGNIKKMPRKRVASSPILNLMKVISIWDQFQLGKRVAPCLTKNYQASFHAGSVINCMISPLKPVSSSKEKR